MVKKVVIEISGKFEEEEDLEQVLEEHLPFVDIHLPSFVEALFRDGKAKSGQLNAERRNEHVFVQATFC